MLSSHAALGRRLPVICLALLGLAATSSGLQAGGVDCSEPGRNSPAFPVPEFLDGSRLWPTDFRPAQPGEQLPIERDSTDYISITTYSESHGTPFLFYGVVGSHNPSITVERLLDLTHLGGTNQLTEITARGETYTDPCNGSSIGYWSDYYGRNAYGNRHFTPQQGKFNGASHFYRATNATVDVHIRASDVLFADGFEFGTTGWIASPP